MIKQEFEVIGKSLRRVDVVEKALGKARFCADLSFPGMLHAKVLRSKVPHGIIKRIDVSKALQMEGVRAVLTADDVPGANNHGIILKDEPVLVKDRIRKVGDPIALVAADTLKIAEKALEAIQVEIEELEPVFDPFEAMKEDAPKLYEKGNILSTARIIKGDVEEGFRNSDVVIAQRYRTGRVEHAYIEPEVCIGKVDGDLITVWGSTQNTHFDQKEIARNLGISINKVRVIQAVTGGGFGGKLDISAQVHVALLALKTGRPVKLVYTREESIQCSPKRHPYVIDIKTGARKDGKLMALEATIVADTGAYASYGPGVLTRGAVHITGPYEIPNVKVQGFAVYTNNPTSGAMGGFGVPQVAFAHEQQMDQLAEKLNMDPVQIRLINAFRPGSITATGQKLEHSVGIIETIKKATEKAQELFE